MKTGICFLLCFVAFECAAKDTRMAEAAGRAVQMTLVKADDLSPVAWPDGRVDLKRVTAVVNSDSNVYLLLQANGIAPDSEAFALVYDLNPGLKDASKVPVNTSLVLPAVTRGSDPSKAFGTGYLVELTLDPDIRSELNARIDALRAVLPSISQLNADSEAQTQSKGLIAWYQQIERRFKRRTAPPLRQASLIQLRDEAGSAPFNPPRCPRTASKSFVH